MNRLPAKTKGPIRVDASDHVIANVHSRLMPEAIGATSRVAQSLDRVLTLKPILDTLKNEVLRLQSLTATGIL